MGDIHYGRGLANAPSAGWDSDGKVRQLRVFVKAAYRRLELKAEVDFSPNDFDPDDFALTDAYLGLRELPWVGTLRFGHQKQPFSLENAASRLYMVFMERSLIERLAPSIRDVGLLAFDTAFDERMRWSIGLDALAAADDIRRHRKGSSDGRATAAHQPLYEGCVIR